MELPAEGREKAGKSGYKADPSEFNRADGEEGGWEEGMGLIVLHFCSAHRFTFTPPFIEESLANHEKASKINRDVIFGTHGCPSRSSTVCITVIGWSPESSRRSIT